MTESIPTTESIKALVAWASVQDLPDDERTAPKMAEARRRFDAWIEAVERAAAEKAWDEGHAAGEQNAGDGFAALLTGVDGFEPRVNPYRREETE